MTPAFSWVYARPPIARAPETTPTGAGGDIAAALADASARTGVSFDYLLRTAERESDLNPEARASTSSATGLFQFIESTWLATMKEEGGALGLGDLAAEIERTPEGRYDVADPAMREAILALRADPDTSALMAGALTAENAAYLQDRLGRAADPGELYIAHFLGAGGAARLIRAAAETPDAGAAALFPRQAEANRAIFYRGGTEQSVGNVYADLVARHGAAPPSGMAEEVPPVLLAYADGTAAVAMTSAGDAATASDAAFEGLFRSDGGRAGAVSGSGFFSTFVSAPAMFEVALALDTQQMEREPVDGAPATAPAAPARRDGPLDLAGFQTLSWR